MENYPDSPLDRTRDWKDTELFADIIGVCSLFDDDAYYLNSSEIEYWLKILKLKGKSIGTEHLIVYDKAMHTLQKYMEAMMLENAYRKLA